MRTAVVLGGGGFLAAYIARRLRLHEWRVIEIGRQVKTAVCESGRGETGYALELPHPAFACLLAAEKPDLCVNAAGSASVSASLGNAAADFESNALLTFRILDDLRRHSPASVYIHISSAAVYGEPKRLPIAEDAEIAPISPYGWHKRLSEIIVEEHARQFSLRAASLRVFSAFGAGLRRQVVFDLVNRALSGGDGLLILQGAANDSRDFVHGADVAAAVELVESAADLTGQVYNVASGVETPIRELARLILQRLGKRQDIQFDAERRPGDPSRWHADITKIRALGFSPSLSLATGVDDVVRDLRQRSAAIASCP